MSAAVVRLIQRVPPRDPPSEREKVQSHYALFSRVAPPVPTPQQSLADAKFGLQYADSAVATKPTDSKCKVSPVKNYSHAGSRRCFIFHVSSSWRL